MQKLLTDTSVLESRRKDGARLLRKLVVTTDFRRAEYLYREAIR